MRKRDETAEFLRRLWYGEERGEAENAARLPQAKALSDVVEKLSARYVPEFQRKLASLQEQWPGIIGAANARFSRPVFIKDGILHVEVSHPAFRMAVDTPAMKKMVLEKIGSLFGEGFCSALLYVPAGRQKR